MKRTIRKLKQIWLYSIPVIFLMLFISNKVYYYWIGSSVNIPYSISIVMAIYVLTYTRFSIFIFLINGIGKIRLQLYINTILCVIYIPIAIVLCKAYGIEGIIIGNIVVSLIHAVISQIQIKKLTYINATGIWNK